MNFATRSKRFDLTNNFNIYDLNTYTGEYRLLRDGSDDQPNLQYEYPSENIKNLFKQS